MKFPLPLLLHHSRNERKSLGTEHLFFDMKTQTTNTQQFSTDLPSTKPSYINISLKIYFNDKGRVALFLEQEMLSVSDIRAKALMAFSAV